MINSNKSSNELNYIKETIFKIDKIQKEAQMDLTNTCILCETSLLTSSYNTIPVSLKFVSGSDVSGNLGISDDTSNYFRIENIRQDNYVTLRLLKKNDDALEAQEYTMLVNLDYIIAIQCYSPISVTLCNQDN